MPLYRRPILAIIEGASGSHLDRGCRPESEVHDARRERHRRHRVRRWPARSAPHAACFNAYLQPVEQTTQLYVGDVLRDHVYPLREVECHVEPSLISPEGCDAAQMTQQYGVSTKSQSVIERSRPT